MPEVTPPKPRELLPCPTPWCGCEGEMMICKDGHFKNEYSVDCKRCGVHTPGYSTEAEAILAWNTRPATIPVSDLEGVRNALQISWCQLGICHDNLPVTANRSALKDALKNNKQALATLDRLMGVRG